MCRNQISTAFLVVLLLGVAACGCQNGKPASKAGAAPGPGEEDVLFDRPETTAPTTLNVQSPGFPPDGPIPDRFADYFGKVSPPLTWSPLPPEAKSVAVVVEDPDAPRPYKPFLHWLVYNLPTDATALPENVPKRGKMDEPAGALQGKNGSGTVGYFGPRPPPGHVAHHYHFQVFALDQVLDLGASATRKQLLDAMSGHVVARGRVIGTYEKPK
jgi:Raf kinase inhibitor-like YbhB/YbcL family protein